MFLDQFPEKYMSFLPRNKFSVYTLFLDISLVFLHKQTEGHDLFHYVYVCS